MKKIWAVIIVCLLLGSNFIAIAKTATKKTGAKKAVENVTYDARFCELIPASPKFIVCAFGEVGEEALTRESLYTVKTQALALEEKMLKTKNLVQAGLVKTSSKKTKVTSKKIKVNPNFCQIIAGTPSLAICSAGKGGTSTVVKEDLSALQEAAYRVHKKFNLKSKKLGARNYTTSSTNSTMCEMNPYSIGCPEYCNMYPDDYTYCGGTAPSTNTNTTPTNNCAPDDCYCHEMMALPPPPNCQSSTSCAPDDCYCHQMMALPPPPNCQSSTSCAPDDCYCHQMMALPPPPNCQSSTTCAPDDCYCHEMMALPAPPGCGTI